MNKNTHIIGVGKSTFLKVLTGGLKLESGTVRIGETASIGYYEQQGLILTPEQEKQPVLKYVQEAVEKGTVREKAKAGAPKLIVEEAGSMGRRKMLAGKEGSISITMSDGNSDKVSAVSEKEAMQLLSRFQFPSKRWYDRVGQLSGGEKRRLQLLQILAKKPNVLLLDEPSNDLDLQTLTALEEYILEVFEGCLVIVSHDNYFVNRVAEHLFVFEGDGIVRDFQGSYTDYLNYRRDVVDEKRKEMMTAKAKKEGNVSGNTITNTNTNANANSKKVKPSTTPSDEIPAPSSLSSSSSLKENKVTTKTTTTSRTLSFTERKEYNKLEKEIAKLQTEIQTIEDKINKSDGTEGYSVLNDWTASANKLKDQMSQKELRWVEIAHVAG